MEPTPADKEDDRHAWAMLQRARPVVEWDRNTLRRADLTGEGLHSRVMVGADDARRLFVGLVRPGREGPANPQVLAIGLVQSLSLAFHKLETPQQCVPEGQVQPFEGCRPKRGKRGLTLTVDATRVTRVYWNATAKRFDSWGD